MTNEPRRFHRLHVSTFLLLLGMASTIMYFIAAWYEAHYGESRSDLIATGALFISPVLCVLAALAAVVEVFIKPDRWRQFVVELTLALLFTFVIIRLVIRF